MNTIFNFIERSDYREVDDEDGFEAPRPKEIFNDCVKKAYKKFPQLRNCYLCRYHAENNSNNFEDHKPIFCKFLKESCDSNNAVSCQYFKIEKKYYE